MTMLKKILALTLSGLFFSIPIYGFELPKDSFLFGSQGPSHIEINNRVIAVVNGKAITVYDLMKKLDVSFYKQFPQYADSIEAKFQFYQYNWKRTLQDLMDKELILADAEEVKLPISTGDIREEMETLFGPDIISNLDRVGLTYEDAQEIVQSDLLLKRMLGMRVNLKSMRKVTPQAIGHAYEEFAKNNIRPQEWDYNIISVRHTDPVKGAEIANIIHQLVAKENTPFNEVKERIKAIGLFDDSLKINISEKFHHNEKEVSESYKNILTEMSPNSFTDPLVHLERDGKSKIFRIFYLEDAVAGGPIPFVEVENKLIEQIRNKVLDEETDNYLNRLRSHFHIDEKEIISKLPEDFEPFKLR